MQRRRPHFVDAILVFTSCLLAFMAGGILIEVLAQSSPALQRTLMIGLGLSWLLIPFAYARLAGLDYGETFALRKPPRGTWLWLVLLWPATTWLLIGLYEGQTWIFDQFGWSFDEQIEAYENQVEEILAGGTIFTLLLIVVLAAIGEEVAFRGVMLRGLERSFGPVTAILCTATLFAAMHVIVPRMPITFVLGVVFALVVLWTRSLPAAVLLHALNNTAALFLDAVSAEVEGVMLVATLVPAAAVFVLCMVLIYRRRVRPLDPGLQPSTG